MHYFIIADPVERTLDHLAMIPKLTATNHEDAVLTVEGIVLKLGDIKTLEVILSQREQEFMDQFHPPK